MAVWMIPSHGEMGMQCLKPVYSTVFGLPHFLFQKVDKSHEQVLLFFLLSIPNNQQILSSTSFSTNSTFQLILSPLLKTSIAAAFATTVPLDTTISFNIASEDSSEQWLFTFPSPS